MPLSELRPGQKAILTAIEAPTALAHRLMALGLVPGTEMEVVRTAVFGDPIEVRVRGFRMGWHFARQGDINRHRQRILVTFVVRFACHPILLWRRKRWRRCP
jgi:ferrous iron transport protein A